MDKAIMNYLLNGSTNFQSFIFTLFQYVELIVIFVFYNKFAKLTTLKWAFKLLNVYEPY